jgi:hypothetical protein
MAMLFLRLLEKLFLPLEKDLRAPFVETADSPSDSDPELHLLSPTGASLVCAMTKAG